MRKYNEWDFLKCAATLLVVIGHITILYKEGGSFPQLENELLSKITDVIYLFHMPLFMAISGAIFAIGKQSGKYKEFRQFTSNKAKRLLIPYYFTAIIFLFPTILLLHMHNSENNLEYFTKILIGIDCRHLWFLWALFDIFIISFFCKNKEINHPLICLFLSITFSLANSYNNKISVFCISMAIHYLPYFFIGEWLSTGKINDKHKFKITLYIIAISGCIIKLNDIGWIDMLFSIILNGGIIIFISSCTKLFFKEQYLHNPIANLFLRNSFPIYLFHVPIIYISIYFLQNLPTFILLPVVFTSALVGSIMIATIVRKINLHKLIGE